MNFGEENWWSLYKEGMLLGFVHLFCAINNELVTAWAQVTV